jgi:hypothetical protein
MTSDGCAPSGCQCACHVPKGMGVAHLVPCCDQPPAPIERFGLSLTQEDFDDLEQRLNRIDELERRQPPWKGP